jgi:nucleoid DNA-binding protein
LLAALLKKKLFKDKAVIIAGFGKFYLFECKNGSVIRFRKFKKLKRIIHGLSQLEVKIHYTSRKSLNDIFVDFAKCTGLNIKQSAVLFYIWIYSLLEALVKEKGCKIKGLGFLYIVKVNFQKKRGINRMVKYFYNVGFKSYRQTQRELKLKQPIFSKRIKVLFDLNNI